MWDTIEKKSIHEAKKVKIAYLLGLYYERKWSQSVGYSVVSSSLRPHSL